MIICFVIIFQINNFCFSSLQLDLGSTGSKFGVVSYPCRISDRIHDINTPKIH